jgi:SAM-dependent methyltransferase
MGSLEVTSSSPGGVRRVWHAFRRALRFLFHGERQLDTAIGESRRAAERAAQAYDTAKALRADLRSVREELDALRGDVRDRLLQNTWVLTRATRALEAGSFADATATRLSGRTVPLAAEGLTASGWDPVGDAAPPDPEGREWSTLDRCSTCGHEHFTIVNPWNKFILLDKAPDATAARYDYAVCHACGILFASRRPVGARYRFLLEHFGEVTAKRGSGGKITNEVLNPEPLTDAGRDRLRRLAARGVFVSDHLGLRRNEYLVPLLRDRFENSTHTDIIGSLLSPRGWRVLEVRSRAGTILDGLRRAWGAEVYAMPIWESQQFLLREVYGIETSDPIDFDRFTIPYDGPFDLIICNHMFTHALRPTAFFGELRAKLKPGGHIYLHNEPDDAEFLEGKQSMLATLNPLHMQAFDQGSIARGLGAHGFQPVFQHHQRNGAQFCLATRSDVGFTPMTDQQRDARVDAYRRAFDRAVLCTEEGVRGRLAGEWTQVVERAVATGIAEFDERGRLRVVAR